MLFVKRGTVRTTDKQLGTEFFVVAPETYAKADRAALFDSPTVIYLELAKGLQPGAVIEIEPGEKEGTVKSKTEKYLGLWDDVELRTNWSIQERAFQAALDAERRRNREGKADPVEELVAPLRRIYQTMGSPQRAQLVARILHHLTH